MHYVLNWNDICYDCVGLYNNNYSNSNIYAPKK